MLYSEIIKKVSQIAFDAHKKDTDKGGYLNIKDDKK